MTSVPADAALAFDRADKAHTDALLDVANSGKRYRANHTEASRLAHRADLEALLGAIMDLKAAEDVVFAHSVPQLDAPAVELFNRFRVDRVGAAERVAEMLELLDEIGRLQSS